MTQTLVAPSHFTIEQIEEAFQAASAEINSMTGDRFTRDFSDLVDQLTDSQSPLRCGAQSTEQVFECICEMVEAAMDRSYDDRVNVALHLVKNTGLTYLVNREADMASVIAGNYSISRAKLLSWMD